MAKLTQQNITSCHKTIKYVLIGLIVMLSIRYIPNNILQNKEIIMISAISSISYAILDMISPTIKIQEQKTTH
jgi:hypothetical protein